MEFELNNMNKKQPQWLRTSRKADRNKSCKKLGTNASRKVQNQSYSQGIKPESRR